MLHAWLHVFITYNLKTADTGLNIVRSVAKCKHFDIKSLILFFWAKYELCVN